MMVLLMAASVWAQEPQQFDPMPVDHEASGEVYRGILVDEKTFKELMSLRVEVKSLSDEVVAFESWQDRQRDLFDQTVGSVRATCDEGMTSMRKHYDTELDRASKRKFFEKHGFPLGVAVGVTASTVLAVGTIAAVSEVYEVQVVR